MIGVLRIFLGAIALAVVSCVGAQEGPIRILVGFPPGGGSDLIARLAAERMRVALDAPVVVENRPGAGGMLAAEALKNAAPDGRTLMVSPIAVTIFAPLVNAGLRFDPPKDFAPLSLAASYQLALAVGPASPAKTLKEYIEWVRADRARGAYGVPTLGGPPHFFGVMLARATRLELVSVPYKGGPPLVADLVGGQVPAGITSLADFVSHHQSGKLRLLGTSGTGRSAVAPDVPTFKELGFDEIEGDGWQAFHTTAGTPRPTIERLSAVIAAAIRSPEVSNRLLATGLEPVGSTAEELASRMRADLARWAPIVKASGYRADQ
jgi:tripartite-type tricarboxylate transporter receptor subunit TctC